MSSYTPPKLSSSASPRKRIFVACTECRKRKAKCINASTEDFPNIPCERCKAKGLRCEYISVGEQRELPTRIEPRTTIGPSGSSGSRTHSPDLSRAAGRNNGTRGSLGHHPCYAFSSSSSTHPMPNIPVPSMHPPQNQLPGPFNYEDIDPQRSDVYSGLARCVSPQTLPQQYLPGRQGDPRPYSSDFDSQGIDPTSQCNYNISALGKRQSMLIGMLVKEFQECNF